MQSDSTSPQQLTFFDSSIRSCIVCGVPLKRRPDESVAAFSRRQACGRSCGHELHWRTRPKIDTTPKRCGWCGSTFGQKANESAGNYRQRQTCTASCRYELMRSSRKINHPIEPKAKPIRVRPMLQLICKQCGAEFAAPKKRHYCSRACSRKSNSTTLITRACAICGRCFDVPLRSKTRKTCSRDCDLALKKEKAQNRRRAEIPCEVCGSFFPPQRTRTKTCSPACRSVLLSWNNRTGKLDASRAARDSGYPRGWKGLARFVRTRDQNRCRLCGQRPLNRNCSVHHIDYNKKNSSVMNLVCLCDECHGRTNHDRGKWQGLLEDMMRKSNITG